MFLLLLVSLSLAQGNYLYEAIHYYKMFSNTPEILQHPNSITVFENQTAIFFCEVSGGFISWAVNEKPIYELSFELSSNFYISFLLRENGNPQHKLAIMARVELNESTVQCLINGGFSNLSDLVSLIIQGNYYNVLHGAGSTFF